MTQEQKGRPENTKTWKKGALDINGLYAQGLKIDRLPPW